MPLTDETYGPERAERLVKMLRELAQRIVALDAEGRLLGESPRLMKELGDIRSELFRFEVRSTFETPEQAEHRRIVAEASREWSPDADRDTEEEEDGWPQDGP